MDTIRDKQVMEEILKKKKMNIFLTGANGYIGRNFIKKLSTKAQNICCYEKKKKQKEKKM